MKQLMMKGLILLMAAVTATAIRADACWTPHTGTCWEHIEMDEAKCDALGGTLIMGCFVSQVAKFKFECRFKTDDGSLTIMLWTKAWTCANAKENCKSAGGRLKKLR